MGRFYEDDVAQTFQPLVDNFKMERDVVSMLLLLNTKDDYTYQHSVQVGMLSYYLATWLDYMRRKLSRSVKPDFFMISENAKSRIIFLTSQTSLQTRNTM